MNIIVDYDNFKKETTEAINKHINTLPAVFIADFLEKVTKDVRLIADKQLEDAKSKEEEVKEDG